jgi:hypothetical protein
MKTFIILLFASFFLAGCVVSPLYGPYGRGDGREHRDRDDRHYDDRHYHDGHRGDPYRG